MDNRKRGSNWVPSFYLPNVWNLESQVAQWCGEILKTEEFRDCMLVDLVVSGHRKIEVYLDSDTGMTFQKCQQFSRVLEGMIEASSQFDEKYVLEVSSPGPKRPMKLPRQYPKHIGRTLEIAMKDGSTKKGVLQSVTEDSITVEVLRKTENKKKKEKGLEEIPFSEIERATVTFQF